MAKSTANVEAPPATDTHKVETVQQLELLVPELVAQIRKTSVKQCVERFVELTPETFRNEYPGLYARIAECVVTDANVGHKKTTKGDGFVLGEDDPFAQGAARRWAAIKKIPVPQLPFVLPYKDRDTITTLENYILRADGASDVGRAAAAKLAIKKVNI